MTKTRRQYRGKGKRERERVSDAGQGEIKSKQRTIQCVINRTCLLPGLTGVIIGRRNPRGPSSTVGLTFRLMDINLFIAQLIRMIDRCFVLMCYA